MSVKTIAGFSRNIASNADELVIDKTKDDFLIKCIKDNFIINLKCNENMFLTSY